MIDEYVSEVLVDGSGAAKAVGDLRSRLDLTDLLDLCTFVEAVSLHDRIRMIGGLPEKFHELFRPLLDAGVLVQHPTRTQIRNPTELEPPPNRSYRDYHNSHYNRAHEDAWFETGRLVGAEQQLAIMALPMLRQGRFYSTGAHVQAHHSACDLIGHYSHLSELLQRIRDSTTLDPTPYTTIPIPPIALEVLKISKNAEDFIRRSLDVREGFEAIRIRLAELRATLADPGVTPQQKLNHIERWAKSWGTLNRYSEPSQTIELANTSVGLLDQKFTQVGDWQVSLRLSDLLASLVRTAERTLSEWRVRILHQTAIRYLRTPDTSLIIEVERIFGRQPSSQELSEARAQIASVPRIHPLHK